MVDYMVSLAQGSLGASNGLLFNYVGEGGAEY